MKLLPILRRSKGVNWHPHTLVFVVVAYAMVDDRYYDHLRQFRWLLSGGYPCRIIERRRVGYLHWDIAELEGWLHPEETDHIDGDRLNNQADNLRPATHAENKANKGLQKNSTTGYVGVSPHKASGKFQTRVYFQGKCVYSALLTTPEEAARAYDIAAVKYHGLFVKTNKSLGLIT